jgi:hypothetical protein
MPDLQQAVLSFEGQAKTPRSNSRQEGGGNLYDIGDEQLRLQTIV